MCEVYKIKIRNVKTNERGFLNAYSRDQTKNIIKQVIDEGVWRVIVSDSFIESIINELISESKRGDYK